MNKNILRLAIPNIISNITVPLLGMIDLFIVGHLSSELYIGAIAIASMIFNFIYWSFSFLRMGTSGFTAQAFGAKDQQEVVNVLLRSMSVALLGGFILLVLQYFIFGVAHYFVAGSAEIMSLAADYFYIYIWAAPAVLSMYAFTGWFIGMQDAKTPMYLHRCQHHQYCDEFVLCLCAALGAKRGSLGLSYSAVFRCTALSNIQPKQV